MMSANVALMYCLATRTIALVSRSDNFFGLPLRREVSTVFSMRYFLRVSKMLYLGIPIETAISLTMRPPLNIPTTQAFSSPVYTML
jgi:hypothetical protein